MPTAKSTKFDIQAYAGILLDKFGNTNECQYTRKQLVEAAADIGMKYVPYPITTDPGRKVSRGLYLIPEVVNDGQPRPSRIVEKVETPTKEPTAKTPAPIVNLAMTNGQSESLVPSKIVGYVPFGHSGTVTKIIKSNMFFPVFITGLSGNGKTTMVDQVCAKTGRKLFRVNITIETDEDDLLGGFRLIDGATVWQDGPVISCMKQGGVLLLDEVDLASHKIMCLQPVLEGRGIFLKKIGVFVQPAAGFTIVATANTKGLGNENGQFIGTNILNEAFLDRFPVCLEQEYPNTTTEIKILVKKMEQCFPSDTKVDLDLATTLVTWACSIRKAYDAGASDNLVSTRRLLNIIEAWSIFKNTSKAIKMCITRFDADTQSAWLNVYSKISIEPLIESPDESPDQTEVTLIEWKS